MRPPGSEVLKLVSDNQKAARLLGWAPKVSIDNGLEQAISFVEANIDLYRAGHYDI